RARARGARPRASSFPDGRTKGACLPPQQDRFREAPSMISMSYEAVTRAVANPSATRCPAGWTAMVRGPARSCEARSGCGKADGAAPPPEVRRHRVVRRRSRFAGSAEDRQVVLVRAERERGVE